MCTRHTSTSCETLTDNTLAFCVRFYIDASYWSDAVCNALPELPYLQCLSLFLEEYDGSIVRQLVQKCSRLTCLALSTETLFRIKLVRRSQEAAPIPVDDRDLAEYTSWEATTGVPLNSEPSYSIADYSTSVETGRPRARTSSSSPLTGSPSPSQSPTRTGSGSESSTIHGSGSSAGSGTHSSDTSVDSGREVDWVREAGAIVQGLPANRRVKVVFDGRSDRLFETLIRARR